MKNQHRRPNRPNRLRARKSLESIVSVVISLMSNTISCYHLHLGNMQVFEQYTGMTISICSLNFKLITVQSVWWCFSFVRRVALMSEHLLAELSSADPRCLLTSVSYSVFSLVGKCWDFGCYHWHSPDIQMTQDRLQKASCFIVVSSVCLNWGVCSARCHSSILAESAKKYCCGKIFR